MKLQNIYKSILLSSGLSLCISTMAQQPIDNLGVRQVQTDSVALAHNPTKALWLSGMSISVDLLGIVLSQVSSYGNYEAALRLNLQQKYFPTLEAGIGVCDRTEEATKTQFKTRAPYFRIGADLNLARNKQSGNRIFVGMRYGFSMFKFDFTGDPIQDPVWPTSLPMHYPSQSSTAHWGELIFGIEAKIWRNFHLGWTGRYRKRITQSTPTFGQAWYIPGYGKNSGHTFGGTFNLIFDL